MNKLTDAEILKALELCFSEDFGKCEECPLKNQKDEVFTCIKSKQIFALDLINRQKEKIDRLQKENEFHRKTITENAQRALEVLVDEIDKAKTEAIKEFAERFKHEIQESKYRLNDSPYARACNQVADWCIEVSDNLVKEMAEGL